MGYEEVYRHFSWFPLLSICHSADAYIAAPAPDPAPASAHGLRDIEETSHPSSFTAETVQGKSFKSGSVLVEPFYWQCAASYLTMYGGF